MSMTLNMSFAEAKDFFQTAVADDNEKVRISFENEDLPLFTKMKNKLSQTFEKDKVIPNVVTDFTQFPAVGMWEDREDMGDSVEYVRKLRQQTAIKAIESFRGSGKKSQLETGLEKIRTLQGSVKDDFLTELLEERRQDRIRENLHE